MAVTYITRDGTKIDGTTGQDHLLEVIYGHALTRMLLRPFLSPAVSDPYLSILIYVLQKYEFSF